MLFLHPPALSPAIHLPLKVATSHLKLLSMSSASGLRLQLSIVLEVDSQIFLLIVRYIPPFCRSVGPGSVPLGLVAPWVPDPDQRNLTGYPGRLNPGLHHLGNAVSMSPDQSNVGPGLQDAGVQLQGAPHHGASFKRLEQDGEKVLWCLVQLEHLAAAASEVHHGLQGGAALEGLVGPVELGVGLLEQRAPHLVLTVRLHEDKVAVPGGQVVINNHVHPLAVLPELEMEDAGILLGEALVQRDHPGSNFLVHGEIRHGS